MATRNRLYEHPFPAKRKIGAEAEKNATPKRGIPIPGDLPVKSSTEKDIC
jgi:hypothetical protein